MAKGFSKVVLMGNVTRDIEVRTTPSGQTVANFTLAVSRSWRGSDGNQQESTSFIDCVAWGKGGEIIAQYVQKGSPLLVSGRLEQRSWDDKETGKKRSSVEIYVEDFNFIGGGRGGDNAGASAPSSAPSSQSKSKDVVIEDIDDMPIDLSEIPF